VTNPRLVGPTSPARHQATARTACRGRSRESDDERHERKARLDGPASVLIARDYRIGVQDKTCARRSAGVARQSHLAALHLPRRESSRFAYKRRPHPNTLNVASGRHIRPSRPVGIAPVDAFSARAERANVAHARTAWCFGACRMAAGSILGCGPGAIGGAVRLAGRIWKR
jgi:hypothetical protein